MTARMPHKELLDSNNPASQAYEMGSHNLVTLEVYGVAAGTLNFEATLDGRNWGKVKDSSNAETLTLTAGSKNVVTFPAMSARAVGCSVSGGGSCYVKYQFGNVA